MGCDNAYCTCEPKLDEVPEQLIDEAYLSEVVEAQGRGREMENLEAASDWMDRVAAVQPEGWHPCLKQKTRCVVKVLDIGRLIEDFTTYNSCHVDGAEVCPRVTAGAKSGEGYELCGPPNHAEQEAAKLILEYYPDGAPEGATAYLYGHTYLCMDCQHALVAAGVTRFVVTGEPA